MSYIGSISSIWPGKFPQLKSTAVLMVDLPRVLFADINAASWFSVARPFSGRMWQMTK